MHPLTQNNEMINEQCTTVRASCHDESGGRIIEPRLHKNQQERRVILGGSLNHCNMKGIDD